MFFSSNPVLQMSPSDQSALAAKGPSQKIKMQSGVGWGGETLDRVPMFQSGFCLRLGTAPPPAIHRPAPPRPPPWGR